MRFAFQPNPGQARLMCAAGSCLKAEQNQGDTPVLIFSLQLIATYYNIPYLFNTNSPVPTNYYYIEGRYFFFYTYLLCYHIPIYFITLPINIISIFNNNKKNPTKKCQPTTQLIRIPSSYNILKKHITPTLLPLTN